ncbi:uncharacterized protein LOC133311484 [Gastrolobium bilobum]|uniref:uncharacterized protein LOC133311484 n=1 Tax=Gastrolobium bilobum TaxID=150636 RepID=UPI002AB19BEB|nr:uncharacterized protein LOC133311484 [Gastrolobium bilobum]
MFSAKTEPPQKNHVLQIKQDDKFFSRLLSKESSMSKPSFRMAVAVPFVWESQPGTPKYTFSEDTLPPLTPPPSYYLNTMKKKPVKKCSRSNLLLALFPKLNLKKTIMTPSSSSSFSSPSSSSWSSSDSSKVAPVGKLGRRRFLSYGSSFDFRGDDEEEEEGASSPTSTLCFGIPRYNITKANKGR